MLQLAGQQALSEANCNRNQPDGKDISSGVGQKTIWIGVRKISCLVEQSVCCWDISVHGPAHLDVIGAVLAVYSPSHTVILPLTYIYSAMIGLGKTVSRRTEGA